ncbi:MmgE/PrpD family protein [Acidisphaera sp. L21]|uniref:MmgE/PrpD family protein n=1 Tax=Acidisphaera sp. L21 TaxID=1641851 RepID=UPI00131E7A30|nr:MmgE/PrpD family protein [Acidisphaera sp. L21]
MYELTEADRAPTETVARWISGFSAASMTPALKEAAAYVLLDSLGVMLASTHHDVGKALYGAIPSFAAPGNVIVPGTDKRVDVQTGAIVWGTLGHGLELDEVHLPSQQHIGATVCAAALALGQHVGSTMDQVLDATLVGYELSGHFGVGIDMPRLVGRGFHLTAVVSGFGCAAAAARLLGSSADQVYASLGLTASQASGTLAWHTESHHNSKSFHMGMGARNGITAALLARHGFRGPVAVFAGPRNVVHTFTGQDNDPSWVNGLGSVYEIWNSAKKSYAAGRPMHAALDALLELMKEHGVVAANLEGIDVHMPPNAASIVDGNPTQNIDCRSVIATAAIDGRFGLAQGEGDRMNGQDVQDLKSRTNLIHDPALDVHFPKNWPAEVVLRLKDGREFRQTQITSTGSRDKPMRPDALRDKFQSLSEPVIGASNTAEAMAMVLAGGSVSVRTLAQLFLK